jgi:voltage-gated potassium channel
MAEPWRERMYEVIFEAETPLGRAFDVALLWAILLSVVVALADSVSTLSPGTHRVLERLEWTLTLLFTAEYVARLVCAPRPSRYALSFFGLVDLAAVLPTYLSLFLPGAESLMVIRTLRLLRIFRVLKLARYLDELSVLTHALRSSRRKVSVFLGTVVLLATILGALMYLIEGPEHGFTSIPRAMYWAIVTVTTVGYGDIAPQTVPGQMLAAIAMILGYSIIAVPTGIVSAELVEASRRPPNTRTCPGCLTEGHLPVARYCRDCGTELLALKPLSDQS